MKNRVKQKALLLAPPVFSKVVCGVCRAWDIKKGDVVNFCYNDRLGRVVVHSTHLLAFEILPP
jgi:hypothetical protein